MKNPSIHIARNGQVLGIYDADKVADQLDSGFLLPSDFYYDEERREWLALSTWKSPEKAEFQPALSTEEKPLEDEPGEEPADSRSSKRRSAKPRSSSSKKKKNEGSLAGWIACLFAIGAAAGLWVWAQDLSANLDSALEKNVHLNDSVELLTRQAQIAGEITPSGQVRAVIMYQPVDGKIGLMSGVTVGLYRKDAIAPLVQKVADNNKDLQQTRETFNTAVEELLSSLPSPLKVTLTNADGRVSFPVTEQGDYVLVSSATKKIGSATTRLFWLMGFHNNGQPSQTILLNENNAVTLKKPLFFIRDTTEMASGL